MKEWGAARWAARRKRGKHAPIQQTPGRVDLDLQAKQVRQWRDGGEEEWGLRKRMKGQITIWQSSIAAHVSIRGTRISTRRLKSGNKSSLASSSLSLSSFPHL